MDLDRFMYEFNLVSTLTITDSEEWNYVLNHNIDKKIDYSNSISFYDMVLKFNSLYTVCKKDLKILTKLGLSASIEILKYYSSKDKTNNRTMILYIYEPNKEICDNLAAVLYLGENEGRLSSSITNGLYLWDENHYKKDINLNEDIIKEYLDFGDKYYLLIDSYYFLQNKTIFGIDCTCLFSKINGNFFTGLSTFEISFGNAYFNSEDYVNIVFKLGDNLMIDYAASKVVFASKEQENKKDIIDKLVNGLYINKDKLTLIYLNNNSKKLVKK